MRIAAKLKAVFLNAAVVAVVWAPVAVTLRALIKLSGGQLPPQTWVPFLLRQVIIGAVTGLVLSGAIALFGRRWSFADLTVRRMALCGALGGAVFRLVWYGVMMGPAAVFHIGSALFVTAGAAIGATLGVGLLLVARRAPALSPATTATAELGAGA